MGNNYPLYEDDYFGELIIDEMSNTLSLAFTSNDGYMKDSKEITPKELAKVFLKGLTICSYWMDKDDLMVLINNHLKEF